MFIPLGTDLPTRRPPIVIPAIVALNVVVFAATWFARANAQLMHSAIGDSETARRATSGIDRLLVLDPSRFQFHTLVTYAFLHANLLHILGNMVILWVFGLAIESRLGRLGTAVFYVAACIVSGGIHALWDGSPVIGASGAVCAVTGMFLVLFPRIHIRMFIFFIMIGVVSIPAWWFIGFAIAKDFIMTTTGDTGRVATLAHLGGYACGIAVAFALVAFKLIEREPYDLLSLFKHWQRRSELRRAVEGTGRARQSRIDPTLAKSPTGSAPDESSLALARSLLLEAVARLDATAAVTALNALASAAKGQVDSATLPARQQMDLANLLMSSGQHRLAAESYARCWQVYPKQRECDQVRVMLALVRVRYLNDIPGAELALDFGPSGPRDPQLLPTVLQLRSEIDALRARPASGQAGTSRGARPSPAR